MRKLEKKGLVDREVRDDDDTYFMLSRKGRDYINNCLCYLRENLKIIDNVKRREVLSVATRLNLGHLLIPAYRIY